MDRGNVLVEGPIETLGGDDVTGLLERSAFFSLADARIMGRGSETFGIVVVDISRFKRVNDRFGFDVGDRLLRAVAGRLRAALRTTDIAARLGGADFALLLEGLDERTEAATIARLVRELSEPFVIGEHHVRVRAKIGVALSPRDGHDSESLVRLADLAANQHGPHHRDVLGTDVVRASIAESALPFALERGELALAFQPIVDLRTAITHAQEALLRWEHPALGAVAPDNFIPLAEELGVIAEIGHWVIEQACAQAATWQRIGEPHVVAVNISARQLHETSFLPALDAAIRRWDVDPRGLEIEITEHTIVDATAEPVLHALRARELSIAIDDFGAGYSGIAYLAHLPITTLKLDRRLIAEHGRGDVTRRDIVCEGIVRLAHALGINVVAEGIERTSELERARRLGCDYGQGFLLGAPRRTPTLPFAS